MLFQLLDSLNRNDILYVGWTYLQSTTLLVIAWLYLLILTV